ncbi:hypothetical protein [Filimonas effusa]|uniref:DUF4890 domain-containing protein n=1 Tax=Filimonas effusa TaxID=2508721 RepID=A0A4V1M9U2_9BACT|nr:hypothetical protein [Filimonas effusa]RXK82864.1 hypothetical protein ESB13_12075 [Filimonas effusa]
MKKMMVALVVLVALASGSAYAQRPGGGGGNPAQRKEMILKNLKDSVQLSDDKANKVADILEETSSKRREIFQDQSSDRDAKMAKMKELQEESNKKVKAILSEEEYVRYETYQKNQMGRMMRPGGGRGPRQQPQR